MINKLLTTFNRTSIENNADLGEKIGNIGLGLLRIGFGKTVTVEKLSDDSDKTIFTKKVYSTSARIVAVALFILALPIALLLTGIGCLGTAFSQSHKQISNSHIQFEAPNHTSAKPVEAPNHTSPKPGKHVHFGGTRGRFFDPTTPPAEVGNLQSIEIRQPSKTEDDTTLQMRKIPPVGLVDTLVAAP